MPLRRQLADIRAPTFMQCSRRKKGTMLNRNTSVPDLSYLPLNTQGCQWTARCGRLRTRRLQSGNLPRGTDTRLWQHSKVLWLRYSRTTTGTTVGDLSVTYWPANFSLCRQENNATTDWDGAIQVAAHEYRNRPTAGQLLHPFRGTELTKAQLKIHIFHIRRRLGKKLWSRIRKVVGFVSKSAKASSTPVACETRSVSRSHPMT